MTTIGILYPGHSAEDDSAWAQEHLCGLGHDVALPLVHTSVGEDAHRVDALLDLGGADRLAAGADQLPPGCAALVWACTSGSFVCGPAGAREQVDQLARHCGVPAGGDATLLGAAR